MSEITALVFDDDDYDELLSSDNIDESIVAALESLHIVYNGIITTPAARYSEPAIRSALSARLTTISEATGVSLEGLLDGIDDLGTISVSNENLLLDAISTVVEKIVRFLEAVKDFFVGLWRKIFGRKNVVQATTRASNARCDSAIKKHEKNNKEVPKTIKCVLPGRCYLLFDGGRHAPKPGYNYNQAGLDKAVEAVNKDMKSLMDAINSDSEAILKSIEVILNEVKNPGLIVSERSMVSLQRANQVYTLYHNKFSAIGIGLELKPTRSGNHYFQKKVKLTDAVRTSGWASVASFEVTLEVDSIKRLNNDIAKNAGDTLTALGMMADSLADSKVLKELKAALDDKRRMRNIAIGNDEAATDKSKQQAIVQKLDTLMELSTQLVDNLSMAYGFYNRYITMLGVLTEKAITELDNNS